MALMPNKFTSSIVVNMLDVTRLRVLVAVARHGSVTAAARELNYAQPSVSHHLARLEAETGVRLIQRAGRGIRLTDAGRLLADRAAEVLGRLDAAENELAAHAGLSAGRVRLAAFPSALGTIVPAAAAVLRAEHPGMDVRLTEAEPPEALRMLRAGYVDVALVFRHVQGPAVLAGAEENGTRGRLVLDEPIHLLTRGRAACAAAGEHHAEEVRSGAERGGSDVADLARYAGHRWIAGCDRCRVNLITQCSVAGFTRRSPSPPTTTWRCRRWSPPGSGWPRCRTWPCGRPGTRGSAPPSCPARAGRSSPCSTAIRPTPPRRSGSSTRSAPPRPRSARPGTAWSRCSPPRCWARPGRIKPRPAVDGGSIGGSASPERLQDLPFLLGRQAVAIDPALGVGGHRRVPEPVPGVPDSLLDGPADQPGRQRPGDVDIPYGPGVPLSGCPQRQSSPLVYPGGLQHRIPGPYELRAGARLRRARAEPFTEAG